MSSALLENDFKKTAKVMTTDRNQIRIRLIHIMLLATGSWVRTLPKHEIEDLGGIEKVNQAMPSVDTYWHKLTLMRDAANILTSSSVAQ